MQKCRILGIRLDGMTCDASQFTFTAHTVGRTAKCPCCGRRSARVHSLRLRKIQCTEFLGHRAHLVLRVRHFVCNNPKCSRRIFSEPLALTGSYGRHTHNVEERIRHEALRQASRNASETLAMQHIVASRSSILRRLVRLGRANPDVRTSGYIGIDDFAKCKGHKYMCVIADLYTRQPLAVFDSRYGQEITAWLRSHPEIKAVTRDGSAAYAAIISEALGAVRQVSDRFHLMQCLKRSAVEPIKAMLRQKGNRLPYPYPSEEEAYREVVDAICQMGERRHRDRVSLFYAVRRLRDTGMTVQETARELNIVSRKVYKALSDSVCSVLTEDQRRAMRAAREIARVACKCLTPESVAKRLTVKLPSRLLHRCLYPLICRYRMLREEVRRKNKALGLKQGTGVKVKSKAIWKYIVTGKTRSETLRKLKDTHPEVERIIQICMDFRKMIHDEEDAPDMEQWLEKAEKCKVRDIKAFAWYIGKDREAVEEACNTRFSNAMLEGTVNKIKAIKRNMYNRAKVETLRAKVLYSGMKWEWIYHQN